MQYPSQNVNIAMKIASEWNDGFDQKSDPMNQQAGGQINMLVERQIFLGFIPKNWHKTMTRAADTPFFPILWDSQWQITWLSYANNANVLNMAIEKNIIMVSAKQWQINMMILSRQHLIPWCLWLTRCDYHCGNSRWVESLTNPLAFFKADYPKIHIWLVVRFNHPEKYEPNGRMTFHIWWEK